MRGGRSPQWPDRRVKPRVGAVTVDWGHPLARTLLSYVLVNEEGSLVPMRDLGRANLGTPQAGLPPVGVSSAGLTRRFTGSGNIMGFSDPLADGRSQFTVMASLVPYSTGSGYQMVYGDTVRMFVILPFSYFDGTLSTQTTTPSLGIRHLLGATYDNNDLRFYLDGRADGVVNGAGRIFPNRANEIAVGGNTSACDFDLDWLGIWGTPLAPEAMAWLAAEPYSLVRPLRRRRISIAAAAPPVAAETVTVTLAGLA